MSDVTTKELAPASQLTMDEFLREVISQMFENDNDTTQLQADLESAGGETSTLVFQVRIESINGVATREDNK